MRPLPKGLRVTSAVLDALPAGSAMIGLWALGPTDQSGLARLIAWKGVDADDWQRFPARPIAAPAESFRFRNGRRM